MFFSKSSVNIGVVDDDIAWLNLIEKVYTNLSCKTKKINIDTYLYPTQEEKFIKKCNKYDYILVDYLLGGTNGANLAKKVLRETTKPKVFIISGEKVQQKYIDHFKRFFTKNKILSEPGVLFETNGCDIDQVVETVVLAQKLEICAV